MSEDSNLSIVNNEKLNKFLTILSRIEILLKIKKENTPLTSEQKIKKIFSEENNLYEFTTKLLPLFIGLGLFFFWILSYTNNDSNFMLFIFPMYAFALPFFLLHWRIIYKSREAKKTNSSKPYFENLSFERGYLRFRYIERLYKISIVVLIIVSLFVGLGLHYTNKTINDNREYYFQKLSEYDIFLDKITNFSDAELQQFIISEISEMTEYRKGNFLKNLFFDEFTLQAKNNNDPDLEENAWVMASNRVDKMNPTEIIATTIDKINHMTHEQLLKYATDLVSSKKPSSIFYDNESSFRQFNFLLSLALLPGSMFYSVFLCRQFFRQNDFFYNSSIGCFKIMLAINSDDGIRKRKYLKLGIEQYEKFLKKTLNLRFDKIYNIESKLLNQSPSDINDTGMIILEKLEKNHHLSLSEYFANKLERDTSTILVKDPLIDKLKEFLPLIATIVSSIIGAAGFFVGVVGPALKS